MNQILYSFDCIAEKDLCDLFGETMTTATEDNDSGKENVVPSKFLISNDNLMSDISD